MSPFATYQNFADCVSKNNDKGDPEAYCGKIKHQVEDLDNSQCVFTRMDCLEKKYPQMFTLRQKLDVSYDYCNSDNKNHKDFGNGLFFNYVEDLLGSKTLKKLFEYQKVKLIWNEIRTIESPILIDIEKGIAREGKLYLKKYRTDFTTEDAAGATVAQQQQQTTQRNIPLEPVMSSTVMARGVADNKLYVRFHSSPSNTYKYKFDSNEEAVQAAEAMTEESPGRWVWENLRGHQAGSEVTPDKLGHAWASKNLTIGGIGSAGYMEHPYEKIGKIIQQIDEVPGMEATAEKLRKFKTEVKAKGVEGAESAMPIRPEELEAYQKEIYEEKEVRKKVNLEVQGMLDKLKRKALGRDLSDNKTDFAQDVRYGRYERPLLSMSLNPTEAKQYGNLILAFKKPEDAWTAGASELRSEMSIESEDIYVYDPEEDKFYTLESVQDGDPDEKDVKESEMVYHGTSYENLYNIWFKGLKPQWNTGEYEESEEIESESETSKIIQELNEKYKGININKGEGKGWFGESERHSKARKEGHADLTEEDSEPKGKWITIKGRHILVKEGESIHFSKDGSYKTISGKEKEVKHQKKVEKTGKERPRVEHEYEEKQEKRKKEAGYKEELSKSTQNKIKRKQDAIKNRINKLEELNKSTKSSVLSEFVKLALEILAESQKKHSDLRTPLRSALARLRSRIKKEKLSDAQKTAIMKQIEQLSSEIKELNEPKEDLLVESETLEDISILLVELQKYDFDLEDNLEELKEYIGNTNNLIEDTRTSRIIPMAQAKAMFEQRSEHSKSMDRRKLAKKVYSEPTQSWMNRPNYSDVEGIDTPGSAPETEEERQHREAIQTRRESTKRKQFERNASKRLNKYIRKIDNFLILKDFTNAEEMLDTFVQYVANLEGSQKTEWTREANKLTNIIREAQERNQQETQERNQPETQRKRKKKIKWKFKLSAYQGGKEIENINNLDPTQHHEGETFTLYTYHPKTNERAGKAEIRFTRDYNRKTGQMEFGVYLDLLMTERKFRHMGVVKAMMPQFVYWLDKNNLICKGHACPIDRISPVGLNSEQFDQWNRQNYEELRDMYKHFGAELEESESLHQTSVHMVRYPHPERIMVSASDMGEINIEEIEIDPDNIFEIDGYYFYFDEEKKQFYELQFNKEVKE